MTIQTSDGNAEPLNLDEVHTLPKDSGRHIEALPRLSRAIVLAAETLLLLFALGMIGLFLYVALGRVAYPYDLEWCEDAVLQSVQRVLDGKPLYIAPSVEYVSYQYTPLYYYVCAGFCRIMGVGYFPLRLVSLLSTVAVFALIYILVRNESRSRYWGIVAAGFYAACFPATGGWFDLARVDSLFLALVLFGVYQLRYRHRTLRGAAAFSLTLFLAYFTKQTAVILFMPPLFYLLFVRPVRTAVSISLALAGIAAATLYARIATDGWYRFYTYSLLRQHGHGEGMFLGFWKDDVFDQLAILTSLAFASLLFLAVVSRKRRLFYPALACGITAASWMSRMHAGSAKNSTMPFFAILAILAGLGGAMFQTYCRRLPHHERAAARGALSAACIIQFAILLYWPSTFVPGPKDYQTGRKFVELVRHVKGEVYIPCQVSLAMHAGKKPYASYVPVWDVMRGKDEPLKKNLNAALQRAFDKGQFALVFLARKYELCGKMLGGQYVPVPDAVFKSAAFTPPGEFWGRPSYVYVNKAREKELLSYLKSRLPLD